MERDLHSAFARPRPLPTLVVVDDDADDRALIEKALRQLVRNEIRPVAGGEALLDYLRERQACMDPHTAACCIVLLDLNMPGMNGYQVLAEMKADPAFRSIPIIVLTTSEAEQDVAKSYDLGANAFITKPVSFSDLVRSMASLQHFWFEIVQLPHRR